MGDVAAGTDVLAQENVEELLPVPLDFTGEGELFMLRVRGDSMIELGILDGDFVIAVQQATAKKGDIIVAGIPGDEATVKTYHTVRRPGHPAARQLHDEADGVPRRRRHGLRPCRHGHAPALTPAPSNLSPAASGGSSGALTSGTRPGGDVSTGESPGGGGAHGERLGAALPGARAGSGGGGAATAAGTSGCCGLTGTCGTFGGNGGHAASSGFGRSPQPGPSGIDGVAARFDRRAGEAQQQPSQQQPGRSHDDRAASQLATPRSTGRVPTAATVLTSEPTTAISYRPPVVDLEGRHRRPGEARRCRR